jgi:hypothetical protein
MPDRTELPMRLALRVEGNKWNAYIAKQGTMERAIWVGSIAMRFIEGNQKRRDAFIALMTDALTEMLEEMYGIKPKWAFSVCQFFADESYEFVECWVDAERAVRLAKRLSESVGSRIGTTQRIIITDGDDFTVFEWKFGEGVTYPPATEPRQSEAG